MSSLGLVADSNISRASSVQSDAEAMSVDNFITALQGLPNIIVQLKETGINIADLKNNLDALEDDFKTIRDNFGSSFEIFSGSSADRQIGYQSLQNMSESLRRIQEIGEAIPAFKELEDSIDRLDVAVDWAKDKAESDISGGKFSLHQGETTSTGVSFGVEHDWNGHQASWEAHLAKGDTINIGTEFRLKGSITNDASYQVAGRVNSETLNYNEGALDLSLPAGYHFDNMSFQVAGEFSMFKKDVTSDFDLSVRVGAGASGIYYNDSSLEDTTCGGVGVDAILRNKTHHLTASYNGVSCNNETTLSEANVGFNWEPGKNNVFSVDVSVQHNFLTNETDPQIEFKREF